MLSRTVRLSREGFENSRGLLRTSSPHFSISYKPSRAFPGGTGIIVPKKVIKSAVGRHMLKRRLRSILEPWSAPDRILIISARKGIETVSFQELLDELSGVLSVILSKTAL